jgi:hypothetical protein
VPRFLYSIAMTTAVIPFAANRGAWPRPRLPRRRSSGKPAGANQHVERFRFEGLLGGKSLNRFHFVWPAARRGF